MYKYTGDYAYRSLMKGDYAYSYRGDPGIFGFLGKAIGTIGKTLLPTPIKAIAELGSKALGKRLPSIVAKVPGKALVAAGAGAALGATGAALVARHMAGSRGIRGRHMNVLNPRALSRAVRRLTGFDKRVHTVEKALGKLGARHHRQRMQHSSGCKCSRCK